MTINFRCDAKVSNHERLLEKIYFKDCKVSTYNKEEDRAGKPEEHPPVAEDVVLPVFMLDVES